MLTGTETNVDELRGELAGIGARIERAAAEDDVVGWMELRMRADALPLLIRDAQAKPLREKLERLDAESDRLIEERERALIEEPPAAPAEMRGTVTPHMMRAQVLDGINRRESSVGRDRRGVLERIAKIEAGEEAS